MIRWSSTTLVLLFIRHNELIKGDKSGEDFGVMEREEVSNKIVLPITLKVSFDEELSG